MKLASIEILHSITSHPNADKLELGKVLEWPVVIRKGEYKEGEKIVFIFPDTVCPQTEYFKFLEPKKYRVNKIRLRKELSYGLVCNLAAFQFSENPNNLPIGTDVSNEIGVTKYEKPVDISVKGEAKGNFPTNLISITDEDNLLSNIKCLDELHGREIYITTKADGSSGTLIHYNNEVRVCSRRLELKEGDNAWWNVIKKYDLSNKIKTLGHDIAIQFEVCGPKMNGNELQLSELELFVFNARNLNTEQWFGLHELTKLCGDLGIPMVKLISCAVFDEFWDLDRLKRIANEITYPAGNPGEGIVIRPIIPTFSNVLGKMLSVKVINENYED